MRYLKKPAIVEAHQWLENGNHGVSTYGEPDEFTRGHSCPRCGHKVYEHGLLETLEGGYSICPGDWIITGVKGKRYPCKPDIFEEDYEPVEGE